MSLCPSTGVDSQEEKSASWTSREYKSTKKTTTKICLLQNHLQRLKMPVGIKWSLNFDYSPTFEISSLTSRWHLPTLSSLVTSSCITFSLSEHRLFNDFAPSLSKLRHVAKTVNPFSWSRLAKPKPKPGFNKDNMVNLFNTVVTCLLLNGLLSSKADSRYVLFGIISCFCFPWQQSVKTLDPPTVYHFLVIFALSFIASSFLYFPTSCLNSFTPKQSWQGQ